MWIVNLTKNPNGSHNDHRADHITTVPDGWAMIPEDFEVPDTFPFVDIEAEELTFYNEVEVPMKREVPVLDGEGNPILDEEGNPITKIEEYMGVQQVPYTCMTVTAMTPGVVPEPIPEPEPEPDVWDEMAAAYTEGVNEA